MNAALEGFGATTCRCGPRTISVLLFARFFAGALTRQRFFYALLFAGFQVKGVTLDFLDDVFGLHFSLEATKSVFE
jgi:hypothetical protein